MNPINTLDPRPRDKPLSIEPFRLKSRDPKYLEIPNPDSHPSFWDVLLRRRTRRTFCQLDSVALSALLWYTMKSTSKSKSDAEARWEHRAVPSAGGIHPIDVLIQQPQEDGFQLQQYDPVGHALREIEADQNSCRELRLCANSVIDVQMGTILWLIGDFNKANARYENSSSLVWRDVGVLIGALCFTAEALSLNSCPLGICGDAWLRTAISLPDGVHGVGAVIVGSCT